MRTECNNDITAVDKNHRNIQNYYLCGKCLFHRFRSSKIPVECNVATSSHQFANYGQHMNQLWPSNLKKLKTLYKQLLY